jgi:hypothetical protein
MTDLSHFIDGARVAGRSGRFADVFNPATGAVEARAPLASAEEVAAGRRRGQGRLAGLGADAGAAPRAHPRPLQVPPSGEREPASRKPSPPSTARPTTTRWAR